MVLTIVNDAESFDFLASVAGMIRTDWRYVGDDLTYVMAMLIFYAMLRS